MIKKYFATFAVASLLLAGAAVYAAGTDTDDSAAESAAPEVTASNVWEGVYTDDQAARGKEVYEVSCIGCHAATLRGTPGAPGIAGGRFTFNWDGRNLGELHAYIVHNMPVGQAGTLSDQQYADIVAYILQVNEFPAGETELATDPVASDGVLITRTAE